MGRITDWYKADAEAETKEYVTISDTLDYYTEAFDEDDADASEGTIVLVTASQADYDAGKATTVVKAEKIANQKVTKAVEDETFVAGGKTYKYAAINDGDVAAYDNSYDIYVDSYGYVVALETVATSSNTAYAVMEATDTQDAGLFGGAGTPAITCRWEVLS